MKHLIVIPFKIFFFFLIPSISFGQSTEEDVNVSDVENFWIAFDSVQATADKLKQLDFIQKLYIDRGSRGLKAFMRLRNFDATRLLKTIHDYPSFWNSIRPRTLIVYEKKPFINQAIQKFKELYPDYREAQVFFTISAVRAGGTAEDDMVLVGTEIAVGNAFTDVHEFPDKRLENFFKTQKIDNILSFTIHEYVHTQQKREGVTLLGQAIYEGACDLVTEFVLAEKLEHAYLQYGRVHEEELKKQFKQEMFSEDYSQWLYNGSNEETVGDLGYFMGYVICKSYYELASDKKQAIKEIIELDYADSVAVKQFLNKSKYYD